MSIVAGWYPDPHDPSIVRWWDGGAWTQLTRAIAPQHPPTSQSSGASVHSRSDGVTANQVLAAEERLAALRRELEAVEEAIEIQSFGFYRPRYGFDASEEYAARLQQV